MPRFQYEAMDNTGLEIKDIIEAESEQQAQAKVREKGFFVIRIRSLECNPLSLRDRVESLREPQSEPQSYSEPKFGFAQGLLIGLVAGLATMGVIWFVFS